MSDEKRDLTPPEPEQESWTLDEAPKPAEHPEDVLAERLAEEAGEVTNQLQDLKEELVPPASPAEEGGDAVVSPGEPEPTAEPQAAAPAEVEMAGASEVPPAAPAQPTEPQTKPVTASSPAPEGNNDDRLMAALAWFTMVILQLPIVSVIQLLSPSTKDRPFQRHHAITSLLFYGAAIIYEILAAIVYAILGAVTLGCGYACLWIVFFLPHLVALYYAFQAYNGKRVELPVLSDLGRRQGWE